MYYSSYQIFIVNILEIKLEFNFFYVLFMYLNTLKIRSDKNKNNLFIFTKFLILLITISLVISLPTMFDFGRPINGYLYGIIVPFLLLLSINTSLNRKNLNKTIMVIVFSSTFHLLFSVFLEYSNQSIFNIVNPFGRISGIFGNTLMITLISLYSLPLILYRLGQEKINYKKIILYLTLILHIVMVFLTASRGGIIITIIATFLYLFSIGNKRKIVKNTIVSAVVLVLSTVIFLKIFPDSVSTFQNRLDFLGLKDSARVSFFETSLKLVSDNILTHIFGGRGLGNFSLFYNEITINEITSAHNLFINILVEMGLVVGLLFLFIFIYMIVGTKSNDYKIFKLQVIVLFLYSIIVGSSIILFTRHDDGFLQTNNIFSVLLFISIGLVITSIKKPTIR